MNGKLARVLLYDIFYNRDDPSYTIHDFYRIVYETVESLRLKGLIALVLIQYTKVKDFTFEPISVSPVPDEAIPAILRNPENWERSSLRDSLEQYMYQSTPKGDAYMRAVIQGVTE